MKLEFPANKQANKYIIPFVSIFQKAIMKSKGNKLHLFFQNGHIIFQNIITFVFLGHIHFIRKTEKTKISFNFIR